MVRLNTKETMINIEKREGRTLSELFERQKRKMKNLQKQKQQLTPIPYHPIRKERNYGNCNCGSPLKTVPYEGSFITVCSKTSRSMKRCSCY